MCRELVAKDLKMFKSFMRFFSPKFTMRNFRDTRTNVVRMSYDSRATVFRKHANTSRLPGEKIKLSDIRTNVVRHFHECLATVVRKKMKISYICGNVVRHYTTISYLPL